MSDFAGSLPIRTENNGDAVVEICDGTTPSQKLAVDAAGKITVKLDDAAGTGITSQANGGQQALDVGIDVAGVQIDPRQIRALTSADVVTADQGAPNSAANGWPVMPTDGTNSQAFTALGEGKVITTNDSVIKAQLQDNAGTAITLGQKVMASSVPVVIASDQSPVPVTITNVTIGTPVNKYNTTTNLAAGASANHDYIITVGKTFYGKKFWAASSDKIKIDCQTSPDGVTFTTFWTGFNSVATPNITIDLDELVIVDSGVGSTVRIVVTNEAHQADNVYSTISGNEQ